MIDAQVAAEDQSFWNNPCVDLRSIVRAFLQNFQAGETVSGASTICQQLVRMRLFSADLLADPSRQVERKIKEAILALRLDGRYSGTEGKQRILEMYMNQSYYGNNAYGIWAAANAYFGKDLTSDAPEDQLTASEAAMLAGLVRAPSRLDPSTEAVQEERDGATVYVVPPTRPGRSSCATSCSTRCSSPDFITQEQYDEAIAEEIVLAPPADNAFRAPHFVYAVRREANELLEGEDLLDTGGLTIYTTLDYRGYQRFAEKWARIGYDMDRLSDEQLVERYGEEALAWIKQLQGRNINNDAIVTVNYRTGAVLAYVGSAELLRRGDAGAPAELRRHRSGLPPVRVRLQADHVCHGLRDRRHQPGDDVHGRPDRHCRRLQSAQRRQPRARAGPGARCPQVLAEHPGHEGAAAHRDRERRGHGPEARPPVRPAPQRRVCRAVAHARDPRHSPDRLGWRIRRNREPGPADGAIPDRANRGLGRQRHLRPCDRCRRWGTGPLRRLGVPRHRHPGRQHRPSHQPAVGPALPAPDR